jgi:hypothetical protein
LQKTEDSRRSSSKSEADFKVDTIGSVNSSSSEKNVEIKVNENDDTMAIEEHIKVNITDDNIIKNKDHNDVNLIDQLTLTGKQSYKSERNALSFKEDILDSSHNDVKEMLPELTKRGSLNNKLKIKEPKRICSLTKTNELLSTISDTPFTTSNREKKKFHNYSQIKNYMDESNFDNSTLQSDLNSMKKNILNITGTFDKSKAGHNKNNSSYSPLNQVNKLDNLNDSKVLEISNINNYEKINNESMSFSITKDVQLSDNISGYIYKNNDSKKADIDIGEPKINQTSITNSKRSYKVLGMLIIIILCLFIIYIIVK